MSWKNRVIRTKSVKTFAVDTVGERLGARWGSSVKETLNRFVAQQYTIVFITYIHYILNQLSHYRDERLITVTADVRFPYL
jgi:hypothetical protein